jgi:hypothetical protein
MTSTRADLAMHPVGDILADWVLDTAKTTTGGKPFEDLPDPPLLKDVHPKNPPQATELFLIKDAYWNYVGKGPGLNQGWRRMRYWQQYRLIKDPREEAGAGVSRKETLKSGVSETTSADFGSKIGAKYQDIGAEISAQLKLSVTVSTETTVEETHTFQTFGQPWKWALWEVFDVYETSGDYWWFTFIPNPLFTPLTPFLPPVVPIPVHTVWAPTQLAVPTGGTQAFWDSAVWPPA